ncbi:DUF805 domain-containing protein [Litoreibacter roseus]|uniref:DUF805 domain-containing protein n=1 Tax=Litoreibacter roseus TaxID=2601869 RepID=A0A6N6JDH9_9RHOB|nr:DUF805 domain-containing protein [Litoreibacter roseus]GFE63252.1 hypothetical protein KIN_03260 [Litoreibacter roseus]
MGPINATKTCLRKYATFSGEASRGEFWWFWAVVSVAMWIALDISPLLGLLVWVASLVPLHAAAVRRMRDQGKWVWWILILSPVLFFFNAVLDTIIADDTYHSDPLVFLFYAILWTIAKLSAFWMLTGPSASDALALSPMEVTP